jgi:hypothetical protein
MIKKSLSVQITALTVAIVLGTVLLGQFDADLKKVHAIVGALAGIMTLVTVYGAFREKAPRLIKSLVVSASVLTFLAAAGGKLTATNYDQGLMLMRISAIAALAVSLFCMYKIAKVSGK